MEVGTLVVFVAAPPKLATSAAKIEKKVEKEMQRSGETCPGLSSKSVMESGRELRSLGSCWLHQSGPGARNK